MQKERKAKISLHTAEQINEIINELKAESDRATVILSAAKIDAQLYLLLNKCLKPSSQNTDDLLDGDNPLSTFSSKINISFRLGLINAHFAKSLHLIRKIRNSFAHEFRSMSLNNGGHADRVRELLMHFKDYAEYEDLKEKMFKDKEGLGVDFRIIVAIAIIRLDTAIFFTKQITKEGCRILPESWKEQLRPEGKKLKNLSRPKAD